MCESVCMCVCVWIVCVSQNNKQVWPCSTKWSWAKFKRILSRKHATILQAPFSKQPKRLFYTWTSPDGQYQNQNDYVLYIQRWTNSIQSVKPRPGADCGTDHGSLFQNSGLNWRKILKTIRPFIYNLSQMP